MATLIQYRIRCTTENKNKDWFLLSTAPAPTKCPDNTIHTVNPATVVDTLETITPAEKAQAKKDLDDEKAARALAIAEKQQAQSELINERSARVEAVSKLNDAKKKLDKLEPKVFRLPPWKETL